MLDADKLHLNIITYNKTEKSLKEDLKHLNFFLKYPKC